MGDLADEVLEDFKNNVVSEYLQPSNVSNSMDQDNFSMFDNSFMNTDSKIIPANHICKKILYIPICEGTSVRTWDVLLFLPNLAFVIFLAIRWSSTKRKLLATHSPIYRTFHFLVAILIFRLPLDVHKIIAINVLICL